MTVAALGAVAYFTERGIAASRDWVIHTYQVRSDLSELQLELMRTRFNESNHLSLLENGHATSAGELKITRRKLDALRRLTADNPGQLQRLDQLDEMLVENNALIAKQPYADGIQMLLSPEERSRQIDISDRAGQIESVVGSMKAEETFLLGQRLKAWDYLFKRNVLMLGLAFGVVILMLAYNFRLLVTEVAQTKDTEKRVRDNAESYRLMSARILELQDAERRRIARELHDSVGQYLAGLKINLSQINLSQVETGPRIDGSKLISDTIEMTDYAIQEVRTISHLLHPPLLEELGFLPAARWYVDEYGKRGQVKVSLHVDDPIGRLPREVEIALFRVLQEALTNVYRHAAAQSVVVRIVCRNGCVILTVADNGKGIPQEILARFRGGAATGIGLEGMRGRLVECGGQIHLESSSAGTVVEASIPTGACKAGDQAPVPMYRV
jgi:signal transduction histidine kinase